MNIKQHVVWAEYVLGSILRAQGHLEEKRQEATNLGHLLFKADFLLHLFVLLCVCRSLSLCRWKGVYPPWPLPQALI